MRANENVGHRRKLICSITVLLIVATSVALNWTPPSASAATSSSLRRYPYISEVVGNSATLNWATDTSQSSGGATWGPVSNGSCTPTNSATATKVAITVGSTSEYQWRAGLVFPGPGTFCYRIQLGATDLLGTDPSPQVKTAAAASPFSFAVVGDWGAGTPDEANVMSQIAASPASFVVTVGDNVYNSGTDTEYGDLSQGNVFPPQYLPKLGSRPIFAAQGNHGFTTNLPYLQNFPAPLATQTSGGRNLDESYCCISTLTGPHSYASSWYAYDWGGARFYVLDAAWADSQGAYQGDFLAHWNGSVAGCGPCGAELQWLKADLAAHANTPIKFAFFHYPLYADGGGQSTDTYLDGPNGLEGLLANSNVEIVFNGHAHQYERNFPQIPGKPLVDYVSGGGGDALGSVSGCSAFDAYAIGSGSSCHAPIPTSDAHVFNFLLVTVNGNKVTVTPTDSTGLTFDQQTYTYSTTSATVIDSQPPALTNSTSATMTFHATGGGTAFTCSLDGAAATVCTSPVTYAGLVPGAHSVTVTGSGATPATASWTVDTSPPATPTNLAATALSSTQVNLTWTASSDNIAVTGYDIYRNGTLLTTTSGTGTTFSDTTAAPSTAYQYTVDARDGAGSISQQSAPGNVTTPAGPSGPTLVQTAASSTTTVNLPAPSTPGDLLVLSASVLTGKTKPITAVSDGKNAWTKVGAYAISGVQSDGEMWYSANAASVSSVTVTTGATTVALRVQEFSGVATSSPLDGSNGSAASSTASNSGPVTPTASNDLAVGFVAGHGNAQIISVTSPGYTVQPQQTTISPKTVTVESGYQDLGSLGTQSFTGGFLTAMPWASGLALFKAGTPPPPPDDFSIAASPNSASVAAGSPTTSTINTILTSGSAQSVALSATGMPAGTLVSFSPQTITAGQSSSMTVTTSTSTPAGAYPITVTGTGTSAVHAATFTLTVQTPPAITSAASATFAQGSAGTFTVTSTGSPIPALTETGALPTGVSFVDNGNGTATLAGSPALGSLSSYPITITATNGVGSAANQSFTLNVSASVINDFSIAASPNSASVAAGSPTTSTINTILTSGSAQSVALSATGVPSGAFVSFNPQTITAGQSSSMTVTTSTGTPTGLSTISVTGTGTAIAHSTGFALTVTPVATTPHLVQTASGTETAPATSLSGTFPTVTTAGNLLVLSVSQYTGATNHITSVTDSAGNTWTRIGTGYFVSGHNSEGEMWYSANANPVTMVTVHTASAASIAFQAQEFAGVAPTSSLDVSAGTSNTGSVASSGSATSTVANELVVGFVAGHGNAESITVTSAGYTNQPQATTTGTIATVITGYQVLGTPGAQSFSGSFPAAMYWAAGIAIFKP